MSDWELNDKVTLYELLKGCFNGLTKEDAADCYDEVKEYGLSVATQAAKEHRDALGTKAYRPLPKQLGAIAHRIATQRGETEAARIREQQARSEIETKHEIAQLWVELTERQQAFSDEELADWKARWLKANPLKLDEAMLGMFSRQDPRTSRRLLSCLIEFGLFAKKGAA